MQRERRALYVGKGDELRADMVGCEELLPRRALSSQPSSPSCFAPGSIAPGAPALLRPAAPLSQEAAASQCLEVILVHGLHIYL